METGNPSGMRAYPLAAAAAGLDPLMVNAIRTTGSDPVRVLTVDDHRPFLEVAHEVIDGTPGFEAVGEVSSGPEALVAADAIEPDLVLIDVHMPKMSGIEASRELSASHPEVVVVLISTAEPRELPAAIQNCGAAGVLRKQDLGPAAIRRIWAAHGPSSTT